MLSPTTTTQHNNSTQCKTCPTRTFADAKGLTRCKVCQAGTKYDGALLVTATANPCASCPAGTYRDNNRTEMSADNECATCEVGKSSPASAASASSCTFCAAGKVGRLENGTCLLSREMCYARAILYSQLFTHSLHCCASFPTVSTVLALCRDCSPGYYSSIAGSTSGCTYCPIGKYTNGSGSASCEDCPAGRYNDKSAQNNKTIACKLCPEGRYGDKPGAYSQQCSGPCPKGSYSRPGATECILCPPGRYNDVAGYGVLDFKTYVCKMCNIGNYEAPRGSTCCQK